MSTLYDKLGGASAVDLAVEKFYEKVLADERVQHFFAGTNMQQQKQHQKAFMTYAFGGESHWDGRPFPDAHKELVAEMGLTDSHFDAIAEDLIATLVEMEVPQALIDEVVQIVGSTSHRNDVRSSLNKVRGTLSNATVVLPTQYYLLPHHQSNLSRQTPVRTLPQPFNPPHSPIIRTFN